MLLGGISYLLPVIRAAKEQGYFVITADYLPDNVAHKYSDEYVNVSIIDKAAVLKAAQEKQIDGIMSFGVDPGVVSAAYVQEQMGLPAFGPFKSVEILQDKVKFRAFLAEHGFNVPKARGFRTKKDALSCPDWYDYPVIVKPADSAGSKGVTRVDSPEDLPSALDHAFSYSLGGQVIVEEFIEKAGFSSDTDSFSDNGILSFVSFNSQYFDVEAAGPYVPAAYTWPSSYTKEQEDYLSSEIQRLITLLGMKTAVYNIETRIGKNGKPYIMELTPRGGGNRLCEMIRYSTGVDLITAVTRAMVGDPFDRISQKPYSGHWAEVILHAGKAGRFQGLSISESIPADVIERDIWAIPGQQVNAFYGANDAIGTLVLKFRNADEMKYAVMHQQEWLKVKID